jgi:hypothetical protein
MIQFKEGGEIPFLGARLAASLAKGIQQFLRDYGRLFHEVPVDG